MIFVLGHLIFAFFLLRRFHLFLPRVLVLRIDRLVVLDLLLLPAHVLDHFFGARKVHLLV